MKNINSHRNPTKQSKAPPPLNSSDRCADSGLGFASIKRKPLSLQFADRTELEIDQERNDSVRHVDDEEVDTEADDKMTLRQLNYRHKNPGDDEEEEVGSDEDDKMSLRQLKDRHIKVRKHNDDEVCSDADDKMTLGKLIRCKSKNRKLTSHPDTSSKKEDVNFRPDEDDDLKVHLSFLKSKHTKSLAAKKRCINRDVFAVPNTVISVKTEQVQVSDVPMKLKEDSPLFSNIKAEVPEPEFSGIQSSNLLVGCSSSEVPVLLNEHSPPQVKPETSEPKSFGHKTSDALTGHSSISCREESSSAEIVPSKVSEMVGSQRKTCMYGEEQQCCMLNEMSYELMEYFEPESSPESCGDMRANDPKKSFETEVDMHLHPHKGFLETISPARDKNLDVHTNQHEFVEQRSCNFGSQVSDTVLANKADCTDDEVACTNLGSRVSDTVLANKVTCTNCYNGDGVCVSKDEVKNQKNGSTITPFKKCISYGDSHSCSNTDNDLDSVEDRTTYEDQLSICCSGDPTNSCFDTGNAFIEKFLIVEEKQLPKSASMDEEKPSTLRSQPGDLAGMKSTSELQQLPERLLSKRKAISPSSQKQLRLATNSADLQNELDNYKCKEKLQFGEYTESKHPSEHPGMASSSINESFKVVIGPNEIAKRFKSRRKGSELDGNLEGLHLSQPLPLFSTGCTSIQQFSASAVAFSEQQMHDTELLAMNLMNELKSMKDIVEGKFQFEACSNVSLKNEADKVRVAIKNANKAEGKARRWLSMMNKNCTRFCKIMKMSQDGAAPSKHTVHNERKIKFADEAGGMLCHVNYFSNAMISKQSDDGKEV